VTTDLSLLQNSRGSADYPDSPSEDTGIFPWE